MYGRGHQRTDTDGDRCFGCRKDGLNGVDVVMRSERPGTAPVRVQGLCIYGDPSGFSDEHMEERAWLAG